MFIHVFNNQYSIIQERIKYHGRAEWVRRICLENIMDKNNNKKQKVR